MAPSAEYLRFVDGEWWFYYGGSKRTRAKQKQCEACGETFHVHSSAYQRRRFCSRRCSTRATAPDRRGSRAPRWKGGRRLNPDGYVMVWKPDYPAFAGTQRKYVMEHRLVMEQTLGRSLQSFERVHHRNGKRDDNRPENLELWITSHPYGQRPEDVVDFVLKHYRDLLLTRL